MVFIVDTFFLPTNEQNLWLTACPLDSCASEIKVTQTLCATQIRGH